MRESSNRQFSLKALFAGTCAVALMVASFPSCGHYILFCSSAFTVGVTASKLIRRTTTMPKRAGWASFFVLSLVLFCVLSIGPASWLLARYNTPDHRCPRTCAMYHKIYQPIAAAVVNAPPLVRRAGMWYIANGMPAGTRFHDDWPRGMGWSMTSESDPSMGMTFTVISF